MNFTLPGANVKMLARAVNCFSKIGNELFFEATPDGLELKTINSTNTAYAVVQFKQDFFISFQQGDKDTPDENCCKISVKPILKIFKSLSTIQTCKIWLDVAQSKIIFQFRCKSDVLKTHKIYLLESEHINSLNLTQTFPSEIVGNHKVFSNVLLHLHHSVDEITFDLKEEKTIVSNFVDNEQLDRSTLRSTLAINTTAFQSYKLDKKANLTFCYKEFKAITMFASLNRLNIQMSFSEPGAPLMLQMSKAGVVQMKFIMGTMQPSANVKGRRIHRRKDNERSTANRSIQMNSEGINTFLTEDISHNLETTQNRSTSSMRLHVLDSGESTAGGRNKNSSQQISIQKPKATVQNLVNDKLQTLDNASSCNVVRCARSEILPDLAVDRQRRKAETYVPNETTSETIFNTNTEHPAFFDGFNLRNANVNANSLASIPAVSTITNNATENPPSIEIMITDSDNDCCELNAPNSSTVRPRKRHTTDSPSVTYERLKIPRTTAAHKPSPEIVPESPEVIEERKRKQAKLRHIFRRCFEPTFDPAMQPGCSQIFAANSDSEEEA